MSARIFLFSFFMYAGFNAGAQDISGTWTGNYNKTFLMSQPEKLVVEIQLYNDSMITGASHLYYRNNKYEHYKIKGVFHRKDSTVSFTEDSTIAVKLGFMATNCLGHYAMKLKLNDTAMLLSGRWKDKSRSLFKCPSSAVSLHKQLPIVPVDVRRLPEEAVQRIPDIQSLIEVGDAEKDSIKIEAYDNGVVDDDSVSVYFNDKKIVQKQLISLQPIRFYVSLQQENPISKIQLVAESLGKYPPCTALMIVTTKMKRYEIHLSSNFQSNAAVEFFLKE
ncbi:MAG: hypothetical protein JWQ27_754 [Ferruginibacter sp.]|nr:hypothetical protein [Ferruginibacter sp.]